MRREHAVQRPAKQLWEGVTKAALEAHYRQVAPRMLPHLRDRPLTLVRAPGGIDAGRFFQKEAHHLPDTLQRCQIDGGMRHVMAEDVEGLVALADQACVELHGWTSRCDRPDVPDRIVFDLDPPDDDAFLVVREAAGTLASLLAKRGGVPHAMVTGSKGIHVVVPLARPARDQEGDYAAVAAFATAVADVLAAHDDRLTTHLRKAKRQGRVFIDTLRNRRRQTAILPWSTRARPGATVATPIPLAALQDESLDPRGWRVGHLPAADPWQGFFQHRVPLSRLAGR